MLPESLKYQVNKPFDPLSLEKWGTACEAIGFIVIALEVDTLHLILSELINTMGFEGAF